jgi:hypothetical protein
VREFTVEARNLRGVIKAMDQLYPGLGHHLEEETTVAIDGAIHETAYFQPIRPGCEVFFIPKLEGGQGAAARRCAKRRSRCRSGATAPSCADSGLSVALITTARRSPPPAPREIRHAVVVPWRDR